ncbi:MAG: 3-phosphoshikimate 1-carboxyvinyltransferase, partial [Spirochaetia bacterium]
DNGCAPLVIKGVQRGGTTRIKSPTTQNHSGHQQNTPLAPGNTEIEVLELNEQPYVQMTLDWLESQGIEYEHDNMSRFSIKGGQSYKAFTRQIPGDFSSATFFLCAAAVTGAELTLLGLDMNDSQGDKAVVGMLERFGCRVDIGESGITIRGRDLQGQEFDLNSTPDALPAMAVTACFAEGTTRLVNVPQARLKETDRITVMCRELAKMGARVEELPDGMVIHGGPLSGANVDSHMDHRVAMALAVGALGASGPTIINDAECVDITFPNFFPLLESLCAPG